MPQGVSLFFRTQQLADSVATQLQQLRLHSFAILCY